MALIPKDTYPGQIDSTDAVAYPHGKARNETGPNNNDGTPWEQELVNDILGFQQALLWAAGIMPSGDADEVGASDYLDAVNLLVHFKAVVGALANQTVQTVAAGYGGTFQGIARGAGSFLAYGTSGEIQTLTQSVWSHKTAAAAFSGSFLGAAYSGALWVLVGSTGEIQTSPDSTTWTHRVAGAAYAGDFFDVAHAAGTFIAVGAGGEIQTSPDGTTWTRRANANGYTGTFLSVTYANGLFVVVGNSGEIQTSPDGATWTHRSAGSGFAFRLASVAHNGRVFCAVGQDAEVQTSPDGVTWTRQPVPGWITGGDFNQVVSADGVLVAVGIDGRVLVSADNARSWKHARDVDHVPFNVLGIAYGGGPDVDAKGFVLAVQTAGGLRRTRWL